MYPALKVTYPFKQRQSCFQRSLWPSKWKAVPVEATDWISIWTLIIAVWHEFSTWLLYTVPT